MFHKDLLWFSQNIYKVLNILCMIDYFVPVVFQSTPYTNVYLENTTIIIIYLSKSLNREGPDPIDLGFFMCTFESVHQMLIHVVFIFAFQLLVLVRIFKISPLLRFHEIFYSRDWAQ